MRLKLNLPVDMNLGKASVLGFLGIAFLFFSVQNGCNRPNMAAGPGGMGIPKSEVVVDSVMQDDVQLYIYVEGKTVQYKAVDVRVRVAGFLEELFFRSGAIVKEGDRLALIEQDQYEIALDAAKAELANSEAREALAKSNLERAKQLVEERAMSPEEYQERQATYDMAKATVALGKANVRKAELDLQYTVMRAPIPGKTTNNLVDVGNYINPSGGDAVLLKINQLDPIYVDFTLSDRQFADLKERMSFLDVYERSILDDPNQEPTLKNDRAVDTEGDQTEKFQQTLPALNGNYDHTEKQVIDVSMTTSQDIFSIDYPLRGEIVALIDNKFTWETASITLRGQLKNPLLHIKGGNEDFMIYPGQVCRVRIPHEKVRDAVLVHEEAILTDLDTKYVLVLKEEDYVPRDRMGQPMKGPDGNEIPATKEFVVHRRDIRIGRLLDTQQRIVLSGLEKGETYIVKGVQRARIGAPVTPITLNEYNKRRSIEGGKAVVPETTSVSDSTKEEPIHGEVIKDGGSEEKARKEGETTVVPETDESVENGMTEEKSEENRSFEPSQAE